MSLARTHVLSFLYKEVKTWWGDARCLYTDTESPILEVTSADDVYADLCSQLQRLDTSNFCKTSELFSMKNTKILGPFKDDANEFGGVPIEEVILLTAKVKALRKGETDSITGKGLKKANLKKHTLESFRKGLPSGMPDETFHMIAYPSGVSISATCRNAVSLPLTTSVGRRTTCTPCCMDIAPSSRMRRWRAPAPRHPRRRALLPRHPRLRALLLLPRQPLP